VLLWPDTFNAHWQPQVLLAAMDVLEDAGFEVHVPKQRLCCGRPLYEFGLLEDAVAYLERILDALGPDLDAGKPVVVMEPACAGVFRDELVNLFPENARARQLARQTFLFSEFIEQHAPHYVSPHVARRVLVHAHCIQKAIFGSQALESLLQRSTLESEVLDAGCCGMAGSFGFEASKYDVSMKIGERVLLPAVRGAPADTLIVATGYSCREQIAQTTGRRALHPAEVLSMGLRGAS
jgi:Fe-S oxidoreductase